jgi:dGTP triphosphohydrolase
MKKFIVIAAVSSVFVMCKKGEATQSQLENAISTADSTANVGEKINSINNEAEAVFDSASIKIKDFEETKSEAVQKMEATSKSVDSLSDKISSMKLESKSEKKDSLHKIVVNVPAPKVIKETKIIYKDKPKQVETVSLNKMQKTGVQKRLKKR